ncbi:MAG TPA: winged helix-turn-helix domain-containing protein [Nitrososphaera sp.]|nr:winged helix-turn-helix domain-containing protein [Nitrososphaera sp.]
MNGALFEKEVRIKEVTTLGYRSAQALNDPVRIKILEILSHRQMTAEEISKLLKRAGHKKATTTVRHHVDTLKKAGLIEVTKIVEVRGAVKKYYKSTIRAFSYNIPNIEEHRKLIEYTSSKLVKVLKSIVQDPKFLSEMSGKDACNLCESDHYKEYAALEILNKALAMTLQVKDYPAMFGTQTLSKK